MNKKKWAKREVDLACKYENPNRKEEEFDERRQMSHEINK